MAASGTPRWFLPLYAMANAGGVIAYAPLLSLLLPIKIEAIAAATKIELLAITTIVGAIAAGAANIAFGMASDRSYRRRGSRKGWVAAGLLALCLSYGALALAPSAVAVVGAIVLFQIAVNMILAPLAAMMADEVADDDMGVAGGALALAMPAGSIVAVALTASPLGTAGRMAVLAVVVTVLTLPLLGLRTGRRDPLATVRQPPPAGHDNLARLSLARLFVQVASSTLFTYLLFYFQTLTSAPDLPPRLALLTMLAFVASFPLGLAIGRWSDRNGRRRPFLASTALVAALSLAGMAVSGTASVAAIAYASFAGSSAVFLSLQNAHAMQILPASDHRGRDLGFVNLANTLPSLISAALAFGIVGRFGFTPLLLALAALILVGCGLTLTVRTRR